MESLQAYSSYSFIKPFKASLIMVKKSESKIWGLQIPSFQRIPGGNCMVAILKHHQSIQHGYKSLFA